MAHLNEQRVVHPFDMTFVYDGVVTTDPILERLTVRAVVKKGNQWLLVHSQVNGDVMFPGGGVEVGESHQQALARELLEECGASLRVQQQWLGQTREYRRAREPCFNAYCIRSLYYLCEIEEELHPPILQGYEQRLQFMPAWFSLEQAIRINKLQLAGRCPQWTQRELQVLLWLHQARWQKELSLAPHEEHDEGSFLAPIGAR